MQFGQATNMPTGLAFIIPAYWQSLWGALSQVATAIGAFFIATISDRFGRRASFFLSGIISAAGIAVLYNATHPGTFLAGKMLNGVALGMALATGQTYISEIAPLKARGILLSAYAFCLNLGLLIAASIAFPRIAIISPMSYRVLFAVGWTWAGLLITISWLIPESPTHLIRKGKIEPAGKSYAKIYHSGANVAGILHDAVLVNEKEKTMSTNEKDTTYLECFRRTNWRRTRIILYCNGLPQMVGATFVANSPYFLVSAGMSPTNVAMVIEVGMGLGCISMLFTFFFLSKINRRTVVLAALGVCTLTFLAMGIAGCFPRRQTALWVVGITLQIVQFVGLGPAVGPAQAIAGEVSALRLRSKSQSIGFFFNYSFSCIWNVVVPYMFNQDQGNLGGKMGFIYLATCIIALAIFFFEVPETRDISGLELDHLFEKRVAARKFKAVSVDSGDMEP